MKAKERRRVLREEERGRRRGGRGGAGEEEGDGKEAHENNIGIFGYKEEGEPGAPEFNVETGDQFGFPLGEVEGGAARFGEAGDESGGEEGGGEEEEGKEGVGVEGE